MKFNYDTEEIIEAIDAILKNNKKTSLEKNNFSSNNKIMPETEKIILQAEKYLEKI